MKRLFLLFCVLMIFGPVNGQNIIGAEYFLNHDPGFGNAIPLDVAHGGDVDLHFTVDLFGLDDGFHTLFMRAQDSEGAWSTTIARSFIKLDLPNDPQPGIDAAAYFFDDDPGHGKGIPIPPEVFSSGQVDMVIPIDEVPPGWRTLFVRAVCNQHEVSDWAGPHTFSTLDEQIPTIPIVATLGVDEITQQDEIFTLPEGPPGWVADPYMHYNMQIIGLLQYANGHYSMNEYDIVAAFAGNECRGVMSPNPDHDGNIFLTVGSNEASGEIITFKAYLADEGVIVDLNQGLVFENKLQTGTISDPYILNYHVTGPPGWEPDQHMLYNMQIIGQLVYDDGTISLDEDDMVGAFAGDECRGVMSPDAMNNGLIFMTVASNQEAGETITFRAYLAEHDVRVDLNEELTFENKLQTGSVSSPFMFTYWDVPPDVLWLYDETISSGEEICYEATETIITAGESTYFTVEHGASLYLAAGENIIMRPGTHLQPGSYVHAFIDIEGGFCYKDEPIVVSRHQNNNVEQFVEPGITGKLFKAYPNPTTGVLWIEFSGSDKATVYEASIYSISGLRLKNTKLSGCAVYQLQLYGFPKGLYLLRISNGYHTGSKMIIKH